METNDYRISFFRPTTPYSKSNRNIIIIMVIVWALAVFGFQVALRIFEKPTPEPPLISYNAVKSSVFSGTASLHEKQDFIRSILAVLGKTTNKDERLILDQALTWSVYGVIPEEKKESFLADLSNIKIFREDLGSLSNDEFLEARLKLFQMEDEFLSDLSVLIDIHPFGLMARLLPLELKPDLTGSLMEKEQEALSAIMDMYLIHNQSFLTDTRFLGFPFHYWYTAEFLLILFIFLCWLYCVRIEKIHKRLNIQES